MNYKSVPFDKRIKDNVKNYALDNLYHMDTLAEYCKALCALADVEILLTERWFPWAILPDLHRMW